MVAVPLATALKATVAVLSVGQEVSTLAMTLASFDTLMSILAELPPTRVKVTMLLSPTLRYTVSLSAVRALGCSS